MIANGLAQSPEREEENRVLKLISKFVPSPQLICHLGEHKIIITSIVSAATVCIVMQKGLHQESVTGPNVLKRSVVSGYIRRSMSMLHTDFVF